MSLWGPPPLTLAAGKLPLVVSNSLTLAGTDGSTLNIGVGGTLGSAAFQPSSAFAASNATLTLGSSTLSLGGTTTAIAGMTTLSLSGGVTITVANNGITNSGGSLGLSSSTAGSAINFTGGSNGGGASMSLWDTSNSLMFTSGISLSWSATASPFGTLDTRLFRDGAGFLAQRADTTPQGKRIYYTFADTANYQRLALNTASSYVELAAESGGTGAVNIDLKLTTKGTGVVNFGSFTTLGAETLAGYILVKDAAGNSRKLAVIA